MDASPPASVATHRIRILALMTVLVVIAYSAVWFTIARQIETRLPPLLQSAGGEQSGQCAGIDVRGFPFRIGLFCDRVTYDDRAAGLSLATGALRSAAQVYQPGRGIVEVDGPLELRSAPGEALSLDWTRLHASFRAGLPGLDRLSTVSQDLKGNWLLPFGEGSIGMAASDVQAHLRRNGPDLDAAVSVTALDLTLDMLGAGQSKLPGLSGNIDLTLTDRADWLAREGSTKPLRGTAGTLRRLELDFGSDRRIVLSGPVSIDEDGLLSGEVALTVTNIEATRDVLMAGFPLSADLIGGIAGSIASITKGKPEPTVNLSIREGTAYLTIIPLFSIPPI